MGFALLFLTGGRRGAQEFGGPIWLFGLCSRIRGSGFLAIECRKISDQCAAQIPVPLFPRAANRLGSKDCIEIVGTRFVQSDREVFEGR